MRISKKIIITRFFRIVMLVVVVAYGELTNKFRTSETC